MSKKHTVRALVAISAVLSTAGVLAATSAAQEDGAAQQPNLGDPIVYAADGEPGYKVQLSALTSDAIPSVDQREWDRLDESYTRELRGPELGKTLIDNEAGRGLNVIPDEEGNLCLTMSTIGQLNSVSCFPALPASGVQLNVHYATGEPIVLFGLATDGVTAISVETSDGDRHEIAIENQAFVWSAPSAATKVTAVETVRFGQVTREDGAFVTTIGAGDPANS